MAMKRAAAAYPVAKMPPKRPDTPVVPPTDGTQAPTNDIYGQVAGAIHKSLTMTPPTPQSPQTPPAPIPTPTTSAASGPSLNPPMQAAISNNMAPTPTAPPTAPPTTPLLENVSTKTM